MDTVRAFVGCLLDLGTTRRLVEIQRQLRRSAEAAGWRASWVPPPNLHLTVKFLGEIDQGLLSPLSDALAAVAARHAPLRVPVDGVGAFPDRGAPRVLFVHVGQGHGELAALARDVDAALVALGLPAERRPFRGHVTLARVREAPSTAPLAQIAPTGAAADAGLGAIQDVTLYRSDLLRHGAEYHVLARHALGGGRAG